MGKLGDLKRLKDKASSALSDSNMGESVKSSAGSAVIGAAEVVEGVTAVVKRSGLTKRNGELSKIRIAKAALHPSKTAKTSSRFYRGRNTNTPAKAMSEDGSRTQPQYSLTNISAYPRA